MLEANSNLSTADKLLHDGSNVYSDIGPSAGSNLHLREQTTMPSVYSPPGRSTESGDSPLASSRARKRTLT